MMDRRRYRERSRAGAGGGDAPAPAMGAADGRSSWRWPLLQTLPRLADLTLETVGDAIGGGGDSGGGGSTVF
ncbi:MAG: hypothetical protein ACODAE_00130 [Gemmatimonadota bacterium]